VLRGVALTALAALAFGAAAAAAVAHRLDANVHHVEVAGLLGPRPTPAAPDDPAAGRAVNLLLLGSDWREGANGAIGGRVTDGMRSDTTIVAHVSADRSRVELVSIPRDSMVARPSCVTTDGTTIPGSDYSIFNEAFALGWDHGGDLESAAACTWRTVEATTGVRIDDFVLVDFVGFQGIVDAIDGVWICVPHPLDDRKAKLHVAAGYQRFDGSTALAFARSRHNQDNDGSDTGRIGNQQRLLAAIADKTLSSEVLTDVPAVLRLLDSATRSLTTSMRTTDLAGLATSLRGVRTGDVTFLTVPFGADPRDKYRVVWTDEAATVWDNVAHDRPVLTGTKDGPAPSATARSSDPTTPAAPPTSTPTTKPTTKPTSKPSPKPTAKPKKAGRDAFTLDDRTASC